jgi:hypothetical protein
MGFVGALQRFSVGFLPILIWSKKTLMRGTAMTTQDNGRKDNTRQDKHKTSQEKIREDTKETK